MKTSKTFTVYRHITPDGKIYVGCTSRKRPEKRWKNGNGYRKNTPFGKAIEEFGWDNIKHEILDTDLDEFTAKCLEEYYIFSFRTFVGFSDCNGYNCTLGGDGTVGRKPTEEEKMKISSSLIGHTAWNIGIQTDEKTKRKISDSLKGRTAWNIGIQTDEKTKRKISDSLKGHTAWNSGKKTGIPPGNKGKKLVMIDGKRHYE